ncbi:MAG: hypothetical protein Tsb0013_02700 [Phycisphaerales bacterium]
MSHRPPSTHRASTSARSAGFGAAIALGAVALLTSSPSSTHATAVPNLPNASAQRLAMIDAIEKVDDRLAKIEKLLVDGELVVKISEMPDVTVAE